MTSLLKGEKIVRHVSAEQVWYGEVIGWFNSRRGRLCIVCETPEGFMFISDPSHLERVNELQKQDTPQGVEVSQNTA